MALIECEECGKTISSEAEACPQCGKPSQIPRCPICKSTDIVLASEADKSVQFGRFMQALFAGPVAPHQKNNTCNKCNHRW